MFLFLTSEQLIQCLYLLHWSNNITGILLQIESSITDEENDIVLDPFMGSGVAAVVANTLDRQWLGFEIDEKYIEITQKAVEAFK